MRPAIGPSVWIVPDVPSQGRHGPPKERWHRGDYGRCGEGPHCLGAMIAARDAAREPRSDCERATIAGAPHRTMTTVTRRFTPRRERAHDQRRIPNRRTRLMLPGRRVRDIDPLLRGGCCGPDLGSLGDDRREVLLSRTHLVLEEIEVPDLRSPRAVGEVDVAPVDAPTPEADSDRSTRRAPGDPHRQPAEPSDLLRLGIDVREPLEDRLEVRSGALVRGHHVAAGVDEVDVDEALAEPVDERAGSCPGPSPASSSSPATVTPSRAGMPPSSPRGRMAPIRHPQKGKPPKRAVSW